MAQNGEATSNVPTAQKLYLLQDICRIWGQYRAGVREYIDELIRRQKLWFVYGQLVVEPTLTLTGLGESSFNFLRQLCTQQLKVKKLPFVRPYEHLVKVTCSFENTDYYFFPTIAEYLEHSRREQFQIRKHMQSIVRQQTVSAAAAELSQLRVKMDSRMISIDIEAYEFDHTCVTEVGIGLCRMVDGGFDVAAVHFLVTEHLNLRNGRRVQDAKDRFTGPSIIAPMRVIMYILHCILKHSEILVGHAIKSDIAFLRRSGFSDPTAHLIQADTQTLFKGITGLHDCVRLSKILDAMNVQYRAEDLHNAGNDALYTLYAFLCMITRDSYRINATTYIATLQTLPSQLSSFFGTRIVDSDELNRFLSK